jgi:hypothetical protein
MTGVTPVDTYGAGLTKGVQCPQGDARPAPSCSQFIQQ